MIDAKEALKVKIQEDDVEQSVKEDGPDFFLFRNAGRIPPGQFYNHKTKTFKKNQRKGL